MISSAALSLLVYLALAVVVVTPVVLLFLLINDYQKGRLW